MLGDSVHVVLTFPHLSHGNNLIVFFPFSYFFIIIEVNVDPFFICKFHMIIVTPIISILGETLQRKGFWPGVCHEKVKEI